jgi:hypothetical protein
MLVVLRRGWENRMYIFDIYKMPTPVLSLSLSSEKCLGRGVNVKIDTLGSVGIMVTLNGGRG